MSTTPASARAAAARLFGLRGLPPLHRDRAYWLALAIGLVVGAFAFESARPPIGRYVFLLLLQPGLEELAFRGGLQGLLRRTHWGPRSIAGVTLANATTSLLFGAAHLHHHAPAWAGAVLVPSLVFGWFRDRHDSVIPPITLHVAFNAAYYLA
jgi:membrane protease YdiL (CAAX protease family)